MPAFDKVPLATLCVMPGPAKSFMCSSPRPDDKFWITAEPSCEKFEQFSYLQLEKLPNVDLRTDTGKGVTGLMSLIGAHLAASLTHQHLVCRSWWADA